MSFYTGASRLGQTGHVKDEQSTLMFISIRKMTGGFRALSSFLGIKLLRTLCSIYHPHICLSYAICTPILTVMGVIVFL